MMSDNRTLFGKSGNMGCLFLQKAQRNEEWKISVFVAECFDPAIKNRLNIFPDAVAPRLDYHTTTNGRILRKICSFHHLLIPLRKICLARRLNRGHFLGHLNSHTPKTQKLKDYSLTRIISSNLYRN